MQKTFDSSCYTGQMYIRDSTMTVRHCTSREDAVDQVLVLDFELEGAMVGMPMRSRSYWTSMQMST